jgi:hypothetical protein
MSRRLKVRLLALSSLHTFVRRTAAVAALWRALAVHLRKAMEPGGDEGLAESGFALLWELSNCLERNSAKFSFLMRR